MTRREDLVLIVDESLNQVLETMQIWACIPDDMDKRDVHHCSVSERPCEQCWEQFPCPVLRCSVHDVVPVANACDSWTLVSWTGKATPHSVKTFVVSIRLNESHSCYLDS